MDKDSIYLLQNIDCNCSDCGFMQRDIDKFKKSIELHKKWVYDDFVSSKNRLKSKALEYRRNQELEKYDSLATEADKMKFQFNKKSACINYGYCTKFSKDVSFIPNTCQPNTQECFSHRKENA